MQLVREGQAGALPDETRIVYVSPLKALSNDIESNLAAPLAGIRARAGPAGSALMSTSAPWCAPAIRPRPNAHGCAARRRTSW